MRWMKLLFKWLLYYGLGNFQGHHLLTFALIKLYSFWRIDFIYNKRNKDAELFGIYFNWTRSLSSRWLGIVLCGRKWLELRLAGNLRTVVIDRREGKVSNLSKTLQLSLMNSGSLVVTKHTHTHTHTHTYKVFSVCSQNHLISTIACNNSYFHFPDLLYTSSHGLAIILS